MIDREWFDAMRNYFEDELNIPHKHITQFSLDAVEIDEDCEILLNMVNELLKKSIETKDKEDLLQILTNYEIRLDHLKDHVVSVLKTIPKIIKIIEYGRPLGGKRDPDREPGCGRAGG